MAIVTLSLPRQWLLGLLPDFDVFKDDQNWIRQSVTALVSDVVLAGVLPVAVADPQPHVRVNLRIPTPAAGIAQANAQEAQMSLGGYVKGILGALASADQGVPRGPILAEKPFDWNAAGLLGRAIKTRTGKHGFAPRPQQLAFFQQLQSVLASGHVGLNEAATGVGKTLAMMCAAAEHAMQNNTRVAIASPSVAVLSQFVSVYSEQLLPLDLELNARVVLGRQNFVSPKEVARLLESNNVDFNPKRVWDWLGEGGFGGSAIGRGVPWLAASLEEVCPGFPLAECELTSEADEDDPAHIAYKAQFSDQRGLQAEILLVTHAMIANDLRSRMILARRDEAYKDLNSDRYQVISEMAEAAKRGDKARREELSKRLEDVEALKGEVVNDLTEQSGLLPYYTACLIDEAHLFEQSVSTALSEYVSLKAFSRRIRDLAAEKLVSQAAADRVEKAVADLVAAGTDAADDSLQVLGGANQSTHWVSEHLDKLVEATRRIKTPDDSSPIGVKAKHHLLMREVATLNTAAKFSDASRAYLQFSPTKFWPQIYVGKASVADYLSLLWGSMRAASCVSATLYLKRGSEDSASYQRMLLAIPESRAREYPPVVPGWLYRPVLGVWFPKPIQAGARNWLQPPSKADRETERQNKRSEQVWLSEVAQVVQWVHATAAGGTMVAMTSYDSISVLADLLRPSLGEVLVCADRAVSLVEQTRKFLELTHAGQKPVWLAVGNAWTGLDVGGHEPYRRLFGEAITAEQDNVLTDLVVPRLPFGTNRSITHKIRVQKKPTIQWDLMDAAFKLKQVIGRPVRREGVPATRRFFVLDGRMNDKRFTGWKQLVSNVLCGYRHSELTPKDVQG